MERFSSALVVFVFVLGAALGKDLHTKEYTLQKDNSAEHTFDSNVYDSYNTSHHERFARHLKVEAATETITSHLLNEIKHRYPHKGDKPNTLRKMMKNLKMKLKKYVQRKKPRRMKKILKSTTEKLK